MIIDDCKRSLGEQGTGSVHGLTLYISSGVRHVSEVLSYTRTGGEWRGEKMAWMIGFMPYPILCRPCRAILPLQYMYDETSWI